MKCPFSNALAAMFLVLSIFVYAPAEVSAQREAEICNDSGCGCGNPAPIVSKGYGACGCFGKDFDYGCGCGSNVRNLGCGCGQPGPAAYRCLRCGDNTSCLDCRGVPFGGARDSGCGCGRPSPSDYKCGKCGDNTSCLDCLGVPNGGAKDNGCGCNRPGPVCGRCGGQRTVCGDCSTTCCPATYNNNPAFKCITYYGTLAPRGSNTLVNGGPWIGYFENKEPHCTRPNQPYICANIRCQSGACPAGNLGCFDPKATILLQDGVFKSADQVKAGDMIYNPLTGRSAAVKRVITGPEEIPMIEMGYDGNLLRVTQDHPVLTKDGIKRARDIKVGDVILDASGNERTLAYVRAGELLDGQIAINFELDISSSDPLERVIVADNIASGDLAVQNSTLPGEE